MDESKIQTLHTWNTGYCADSIEWCPIESFKNVFVCGTYQLPDTAESKENSTRIGKISLFAFDENSSELNPIQSIETVGVLDQKWCNRLINEKPVLGVVNAAGNLQIYSLTRRNNSFALEFLTESTINESSEAIATSLDWSNNKVENVDPNILVTDTKGNVTLFTYHSETINLEKIKCWKAHDYEAWICAFDCWNPSVVYTGGDDCKLKIYDLRTFKVQHNISRTSGVTSLHFNNNDENIFLSGSYDEIMCTWDTRILKNPISELNLGGGIWRLKWEPKRCKLVLAACMLNGFSVIDCENLETPKLVVKYDKHQSLAYGADWCHGNSDNADTSNLIGMCSFYDCKMDLAKLKL